MYYNNIKNSSYDSNDYENINYNNNNDDDDDDDDNDNHSNKSYIRKSSPFLEYAVI